MDMQQQQQRQRRRNILPAALLVVAFTASIGYSVVWKNDANDAIDDGYIRRHHASSSQNHRQLLKTLDADGLMSTFDKNSLLDNDNNHEGEAASSSKNDQDSHTSRRGTTYHRKRQLHESSFGPLIQPYTLHDAIQESSLWEHTFAIIVYDPKDDTFIGHYSSNHKDNPSCKKLWSSMISFISMLRTNFPSRFSKQQKELYNKDVDEMVFVIGSGDYPHLKLNALPYKTGVAPVLMFGSVFQQSNQLYPNLLAMPMPGLHLGCFEEFSKWGRVCGSFRSINSGPHGLLVYGEDLDLEWDDLIPQVIWRGTDFGYLHSLIRPRLHSPIGNYLEELVKERTQPLKKKPKKAKAAATQILRRMYDQLSPRWKGAVLTAEAELEVQDEQEDAVPWANIKFSRYMQNGMFPPTIRSERYKTYDELDIATGDFMGRPDLAEYKYQINLGGGGGTTWTGTTEKLAMPGLLFHHVTPMKDYFHDRIEPWKHYVPVAPDLSDLKEKFRWAEEHPQEAKKIAEQATEFMKELSHPEGFEVMFEEDFIEPVRRIIEAYQPVSVSHPGKTWQEVLASATSTSEEDGVGKMISVIKCSGLSNDPSTCDAMEDIKMY